MLSLSLPKKPWDLRPIAKSSCSSLVDSGDGSYHIKRHGIFIVSPESDCNSFSDADEKNSFETTNLHLIRCEGGLDLDSYGDENDSVQSTTSSSCSLSPSSLLPLACKTDPLLIPKKSAGIPLDRYLSNIQRVIEMGKELKSQPTRVLSSTTTLGQRVINICQGEIGHVMARRPLFLQSKWWYCLLISIVNY